MLVHSSVAWAEGWPHQQGEEPSTRSHAEATLVLAGTTTVFLAPEVLLNSKPGGRKVGRGVPTAWGLCISSKRTAAPVHDLVHRHRMDMS